jgi:hypothetical protein
VVDKGVEDVAVAEIGVSGEGAAVVSVVTGASVAGTAVVAMGAAVAAVVAVDVSPAACPPQADKISIISAATTNSFLIIFSLLSNHVQNNAMHVPKTTPGEITKKKQKNSGLLATTISCLTQFVILFISKHHQL